MIFRQMVAEKKLKRQPASPADYKVPRRMQWNIPLGDVYVELLLRVYGSVAVGVADATSLAAGGMERILREVRLIADFKESALDSAIRSYTSFGVNDGIGGRTASLAGRMLAFENLIDVGTPIAKTDPGLTVGAQPVSVAFPIRLWTPRAAKPSATFLDSRQLKSLTLDIQTGILDTTTAADDTDLLVHPATSTAVAALTWDVSAVVLKQAPTETAYDVRRVRSAQLDLSVNDNLLLALGEKSYYRRLLMLCTDDDVPSDARVTELRMRLDDTYDQAERTWQELQDQAKQNYGLASALAGFNVMDFRGLLGTQEAHDVDLVAKVPAGAVVTADRLHVLAETVARTPRAPAATVAALGGRGGRR